MIGHFLVPLRHDDSGYDSLRIRPAGGEGVRGSLIHTERKAYMLSLNFYSCLSRTLFSVFFFVLAVSPAVAQSYPVKPVRVIVPFAPGGATDILARIVGQGLSEIWTYPVVIDNRPGAGGAIGGGLVAKANPDGYTLFMPSGTIVTANPFIFPNLPYSPSRDLVPITNLASNPQVIVVSPSLPAKTLKDFIALAKAKPNSLSFSSSGVGSQVHLGGESFVYAAGIEAVHVPYKSGGQASTAVLSGEVQFTTASISTVIGLIKQGKLRALGVTSRERVQQLPEVPAVAETLPGFENLGWFGLMAPAGTPSAVIKRIQQDSISVLRSTNVQARLKDLGMDTIGNSPDEFGKAIASESGMWAKIVKGRKLQLE
ncbi:MAG: tripartite tricarboxylate transporter substrate binding protein [Burkholderiales bacterium]|nr:tripartite tricarboxylate transporter substrate binding protein [Burkholderiales bacterium]